MAQSAKLRGHGEDAIYWDESKDRWYGSVSLGFDSGGKRLRRKVSGKTKTEVKDKLRELHSDLDAGVQTSVSYTVDQAVAALVKPPPGQAGRPSRAMTADQAAAVRRVAHGDEYLGAHVILSLTAGIRTEEARALRWDHVSLDGDPAAGVPPHTGRVAVGPGRKRYQD